MPKKVYFKYGVMGSAKSLDLIRAEYNYRERGMETIVFIPEIDTRSGGKIWSRLGITLEGIKVKKKDNVFEIVQHHIKKIKRDIKSVFVDDVHFLSAKQIDEMGDIADKLNIPVLCYGLRSDFRGLLFEASKRLLELADEIEEIKAMCDCGKKAIMNARFINNKPVRTGKQIVIGAEQYNSYCRSCYKKLFKS